MSKRVAMAVFLVVILAAFSFGRSGETLQELVARADASRADQQPDLYMEAAEVQRRAAVSAGKAEQWDQFRSALRDVILYCDKAHNSAVKSKKHIKNTEIKIRRISVHLKETKMDVGIDDQPIVQKAIDQLEQFRTELLRSMFGGKGND